LADERFPSNSFGYNKIEPSKQDIKQESNENKKEKVSDSKPLVNGKEKKKTLADHITENFMMAKKGNIKERFIWEWLIPGIESAVVDWIHILLMGDKYGSRYVSRRRSRGRDGDTDYTKPWYEGASKEERAPKVTAQPEIFYDSREEADSILVRMNEYLDDYGRVSVKDLYFLSNLPTNSAMYNIGWTDLEEADVIKVPEGYLLKMPKVKTIRR
jgi:hypothetical protein